MVTVPVTGVDRLVITSLGFGRDSTKVVITVITRGEQCGHDKKIIVTWRVDCPKEALLFLFFGG
jgi:hypothetical protein